MERTADTYKYDLQVLATDFAPDDMVAISVRATMKEQENKMAQLDAEMSQLGMRFDVLRARRDTVRHSYDVLKAVMAPVRKLPQEILGHVFLYCNCMTKTTQISRSEAPLLLLRVCRRWRRIAEGTPALWTWLNFGYTGINLDPCEIISMWLANSGSLPIDVNLSTEHQPWSEIYKGQMARGIQLILESFHRIHRFEAKLDVILEQEICRQMRPIHAPLLEEIDLYWEDFDLFNEIPISHLKHCISAPKLKSLSLQHPPMRDLFLLHPTSIRSITLMGEYSWEISLNFLTLYGNLSFLDICVDEGTRPLTFDDESRMLLPSLKTMDLRFHSTGDIQPYLDAFEVPMLQDFRIGFEGMWFQDDGFITDSELDSFLYRYPAIQRLSLSGLDDTADLTLLFPWLRELRSLTLHHCRTCDSIIEALTPDPLLPLSSWTLPRLSEIGIEDSVISQDLFLNMIESRALMDPDAGILGEVDYIRCVDLGCAQNEEKRSLFNGLKEISRRIGGLLNIKCKLL